MISCSHWGMYFWDSQPEGTYGYLVIRDAYPDWIPGWLEFRAKEAK